MSTVVDPDTSEQEAVAAPEQPVVEAHTCPSCGAPADAGQLMCLECGSRLALDYQRAPTWRLPAAIVGVVVLLAGIGVAIALAAVTSDADKTTAAAPTQAAPAQSAPADTPPTTAQATPASQEPTASTPTPAPAGDGGTPAATGTTTSPAPAPAPEAVSGWPPGKSAFTVILASMPTKAAAEDKLQKAKDAGIASAAILHSDDFPTLRPGYWVVFDGQYDTTEQANTQAEADRGKGEFTDAYARFVSKNQDAKP
jgi:cell division septation protein DedD